jgi:phytoene dehydrogenase-like protein
VTATLLARSGLKVVVLERGERIGGSALLSHTASIESSLVRSLGLEQHGLKIVRPAADACAPTLDGRALILWHDVTHASASIRAFSAKDAEEYPRFLNSFAKISAVLRRVAASTPPSIDDPTAGDVLELLKAGRAFRALGKADAYRLLRWMPMAVADLASEWFESEPLRVTIAAGGVLGSFLGPRSAGSAAVLMMLGAGEGQPVASGWFVGGKPGGLADALGGAARQAGVEIRIDADVARIEVADGAVTGVTLASGDAIAARAVVSSADPKRTLLGLLDPIHLAPEIVRRIQNIRTHGTLAHMTFVVSSLPRFAGVEALHGAERAHALSGRIRLARDVDGIERAFDAAKYGGFADEPWIELTIPSIADSTSTPQGQHVVSAYVQYAPYHLKGRAEGLPHKSGAGLQPCEWDAQRDRLAATATRTIEQYAPGFEASIVSRTVMTPLDLERTYGMAGGHIFHGELSLDQWFVTRPLLGWARYRTPIDRLYLCGSGTHPRTGLDGRSGANAAREILKDLAVIRTSTTEDTRVTVDKIWIVPPRPSVPVFGLTQLRQRPRPLALRNSRQPPSAPRIPLPLHPVCVKGPRGARLLTADPHVAGSPRDRVLAEWMRDRWRDYGPEQVEIVEHQVLLPHATAVEVEMRSPSPWRASMRRN